MHREQHQFRTPISTVLKRAKSPLLEHTRKELVPPTPKGSLS
ncbi:MAG: hypothetical protein ACYTG2_14185 [Planctomycetota bacterium]